MKRQDFEIVVDTRFLGRVARELKPELAGSRIRDAIDYEDFFTFYKSGLPQIQKKMTRPGYKPQELLSVEFPKSITSDRPLGIPRVDDALVYLALTRFIQNKVDRHLSTICKSERLRPTKKRKASRKGDLLPPAEYWFEGWPQFVERSESLVKKYRYVLVLDMAVYYENIDYDVLRSILTRYGMTDPRLLNLLVDLLQAWAWRSPEGFSRGRGIPQQSKGSAILGNLYLDLMDRVVERLLERRKGEALRWMDGYRIFVDEYDFAVKIAHELGRAARDLMLNLNESKTQIVAGPFRQEQLAETDFFFGALGGRLIKNAAKLLKPKKPSRSVLRRFKLDIRTIWHQGERGIWGRFTHEIPYKRALTVLRTLKDPYAVEQCLKDIWRRPQMSVELLEYLTCFSDDRATFNRLVNGLNHGLCVNDYQKAIIVRALGRMHFTSPRLNHILWGILTKPLEHWYVKCQALWLMGKVGSQEDILRLSQLFSRLGTEEEQRYCLVACLRLPRGDRDHLLDLASRSTHPALTRLSAYLRYVTSSERVCNTTLDIVQRKVRWEDYLFRMALARDVPIRSIQSRLEDLIAEKLKRTRDARLRLILTEFAEQVRVNLLRLATT